MNTIRCFKCGEIIEIDKALEAQFSSAKALEIEALAKERAEKSYQEKLKFQEEQLKIKLELSSQKDRQKQELEIEKLKAQREVNEDRNKELSKQISELLEELKKERSAKLEAENQARKRILEAERLIRAEIKEKSDEEYKYQMLEKDKIIEDMKKKLEEAKKTAERQSQELQGEVLELDLERELKAGFPFDRIEEVKKGANGADIKQEVQDSFGHRSGLILWEAKNALKFSSVWVEKLKSDISAAGADFGIIVWVSPNNDNDYENVARNIWVVKPKLTIFAAGLIRNQLLAVSQANQNAECKDQKMEAMYKFVTGSEFRNRIEAILSNYKAMSDEFEKEKRATQLRWSKMDKMLRTMTDHTIGVYGDFQGLTNSELMALPSVEE